MLPPPGCTPYDCRMDSYQHIAVAIEDSPGSQRALGEASRIAALTGARLSVLHVTSISMPPPYMGEGGVFIPDPEVMQSAALEWLTEAVAGVPGAEPVVLLGDWESACTDDACTRSSGTRRRSPRC